MSNTIVSKISAKKVCGKIDVPIERTQLMEIHGIATSFKTVEGPYEPSIALEGRFRAIRMTDGEVFDSGTCYLPTMAVGLIVPRLQENGVNGLEFGFIVGVVPSTKPIGYEYYIESLLEPSENDPLEQLSKRIAQSHKVALSAPKGKRHDAT